MKIKALLLTGLVLVPMGWWVRHEWNESRVCRREFGSEAATGDYEICVEYGPSPQMCAVLETRPFWCSEGFIEGDSELAAMRQRGLLQARLDCATANGLETSRRCSEAQWDGWCATQYPQERPRRRCQSTAPEGSDGRPPEHETVPSSPVALASSGPGGECALRRFDLGAVQPGGLLVDDDGSVWFSEPATATIAHMTVDGEITRRFLDARPGALARGPAGELWFAEPSGAAVWRLGRDGASTRVALPVASSPDAPGGPGGPAVTALVAGPDGSMWFLQADGDRIGRINPDLQVTGVPLSGPGQGHVRPGALVSGPGRAVWLSLTLGRKIVRVDVETLERTEFPIPDGGSGLIKANSLAAGADGGLWFENPTSDAWPDPEPPSLDRLDPGRGQITSHPLPTTGARWPGSLTAGPGGAVWYLDSSAGVVGRLSPDGTAAEVTIPPRREDEAGSSGGLVAGGNRVWFAEHPNGLATMSCG